MNNSNTRTTRKNFTPAEQKLVKALLWNTQELHVAWDSTAKDRWGEESAEALEKANECSYRLITRAFGVLNLWGFSDEEVDEAIEDGVLTAEEVNNFIDISRFIIDMQNETFEEMEQICLTARQKLGGDECAELIHFPRRPAMH